MIFSSIKKMYRALKEKNRLLKKGMSNIYVKVTNKKKFGKNNNIY